MKRNFFDHQNQAFNKYQKLCNSSSLDVSMFVSNIQEEEQQIIQISRKDANALIPSLESAYFGLQIKGKYLPKLTSSVITADYLMRVLFEKYYIPMIFEVIIGVLVQQVKKPQVLEELCQIQLVEGQMWGFDSKHQPGKLRLVNVLKTLDQDNRLLKRYDIQAVDLKDFTSQQIQLINKLDLKNVRKIVGSQIFQKFNRKTTLTLVIKKIVEERQSREASLKEKMLLNDIQKEIQTLDQKCNNFGNQLQTFTYIIPFHFQLK